MPEASGVTLADGVVGCTFAAAGGQYAGSCMPSPCAPGVILGLNNINYAAALLHSQLYLLLLHKLSIKLKQL